MDFKEMAEKLDLEEDEFSEMVQLLLETSYLDLKRLQTAMEEKNALEVVESAHSIKGASGNMGFMEIFETAKEIELNARENKLDGASGSIKKLKEQLDQLSEYENR